MKKLTIWKGSYDEPDMGSLLVWGKTKGEVVAAVRQRIKDAVETYKDNDRGITRADFAGTEHFTKYEIEPTQDGFLNWLNLHFTSDNG